MLTLFSVRNTKKQTNKKKQTDFDNIKLIAGDLFKKKKCRRKSCF